MAVADGRSCCCVLNLYLEWSVAPTTNLGGYSIDRVVVCRRSLDVDESFMLSSLTMTVVQKDFDKTKGLIIFGRLPTGNCKQLK
jgi:hypothetical protein